LRRQRVSLTVKSTVSYAPASTPWHHRIMPDAPSRLAERGGALFEGAADRSRTSMRTRFDRLRVAWRSIVQASVAATAAYLIATDVVGHSKPFFAPIAAIITLGLTVGQRGRRAFELAIGVAVGIGVADVLVLLIGSGPAILAIVVLLAMGTAVFLGTGQMMVNQAAVSAVLVATLPPASHFSGARFVDALIGGGCALVVHALLLPADPIKMVRSAAEPVLDERAATLRAVADAIDAREQEAAENVLLRARELDRLEAELEDAVAVSRETARYSPTRRRSRGTVDFYAEASAQIDLAIRNVRVLARGVVRAARLGENLPPEIADAVRDLAAAVLALREALADPDRAGEVRTPALRAAAKATQVLEQTGNLSVTVVVGQVRSTAVDLLRGSGLTYDEAAALVREAAREVEGTVG
jgi:uncharacterized membrane protein YgaE (UPF0421/DUF939 family)